MKQRMLTILLSFVFGMSGGVLGANYIVKAPVVKPRIVTMSFEKIFKSEIKQLLGNHASDDATRLVFTAISKEILNIVNEISQKEHVIVMPREAVISGALDITGSVKSALDEKLSSMEKKA